MKAVANLLFPAEPTVTSRIVLYRFEATNYQCMDGHVVQMRLIECGKDMAKRVENACQSLKCSYRHTEKYPK